MGRTMNTLSLLGLIVGIGMLVDNAVVVMENIFRHQEMGSDRKKAARLGAREVSVAVITATLTSVIVFVPMVFDRPNEVTIPLKEIGLAVCVTLLASLFISQTLIPLATSWFIRARPRQRQRWMSWLESHYIRLLDYNLRRRWLAPLLCVLITASAIWPYLHIDQNFSKERPVSYAQISYHFTEETTLEAKEDTISFVERALTPHKEALRAKAIYSWWSDGFTMSRVYLNDGLITQENIEILREAVRELLPVIPGVRLSVPAGGYSWRHDRGKKVGVRITGDDPAILAEIAEEARVQFGKIEGLGGAYTSNRESRQELHVEVDRDRIARYDVASTDIANTIGLTFRGRRLPRFRTPSGEREIRLTLDEKDTESLAQLHNLPLRTTAGTKLPLASVAQFRESRGPERIERDARVTRVWVSASYREGKRAHYVEEVRKVMETIRFPEGYGWSFGDSERERAQRSAEFLQNLILALILVFAVMSSLFESVFAGALPHDCAALRARRCGLGAALQWQRSRPTSGRRCPPAHRGGR